MIKFNIISLLISVIFLGCLSTFAQAQDNELSSDLSVYAVTDQSAADEIDNTTQVEVGDTLEYRLSYTNHLSDAISELKPVLPIPTGMQYLDGTAQPEIGAASLDSLGATFQEPPVRKEATSPNGESEEENADPSTYKRLQWTVESLDPEETVTFASRVRVINPQSINGE